ncbi:hypothetical protein RIF29_24597 [Crotalaria pallida]|uniref:Uncharacterized protein n=1 Tax=Crotalaria pallida TaxID=3830 RepID=A0AAN9EKR2_CROPI
MFSGEQHTNTNKRKDVASTAYEEMLKKVAFRGHQKSQHVLRIPITSPITTPFPPPSSSTTHIPSITNSSPLLSVGPSQQCSHLSLSSNSPHPTSKCVDPMASTPIVMMPTPGLRQSPRDTPQSFLGIGSSSQSAPPGPTLDFLHDDMDEDSAEAFPTGLLLDLPPGWIMPTCKGFFPSKLASKNITKTLVDMFRHPVTSYFKISEDERDRVFFERFRTLVQWDPVHEDAVKKLFHSRASSRLSSIFNIARKKNKRPPFITPELWQTLIGLFNHPDQIDKQQKAKQNRASFKGGSVHTDGSINQVQHVQNIVRL